MRRSSPQLGPVRNGHMCAWRSVAAAGGSAEDTQRLNGGIEASPPAHAWPVSSLLGNSGGIRMHVTLTLLMTGSSEQRDLNGKGRGSNPRVGAPKRRTTFPRLFP